MMVTRSRRTQLLDTASRLFERAWRRGAMRRFWARLHGEPVQLPLLREVRKRYAVVEAQEKVRRPIRVENIVGTDGGLGFDRHFCPIDRRTRDRWMSIAELMLDDPTAVPPIEVVEVDGQYYVIDGHHRVSVARVMDHLYLDADVTVWKVTH